MKRRFDVYCAQERPDGSPCTDAPWQAACCRGPTSALDMMKPLHHFCISFTRQPKLPQTAAACDLLMTSDPSHTKPPQLQLSMLHTSWTACELLLTKYAASSSPPSFTQVQLLQDAAAFRCDFSYMLQQPHADRCSEVSCQAATLPQLQP